LLTLDQGGAKTEGRQMWRHGEEKLAADRRLFAATRGFRKSRPPSEAYTDPPPGGPAAGSVLAIPIALHPPLVYTMRLIGATPRLESDVEPEVSYL
jgi:hypothetical protein